MTKHIKASEFTPAIPKAWLDAAPPGYWEHVQIGTKKQCWPWKRSLNSAGYGNHRVDGRTRVSHLIAFEAAYGPMPAGYECGHTCNNGACQNPWHFKPVTPTENAQEAAARRKLRPRFVLNEIMVRAARLLHKAGMTVKAIAEMFKVRAHTLGSAVRGATWAWVKDEPAGAVA